MQYDKKNHLVILDGNNTIRVGSPSVTRIEHRNIEPKAKHFSHCMKNQSSWPNQIDSSKRLAGDEIELGMIISTIESRASNIPMTKGTTYVVMRSDR